MQAVNQEGGLVGAVVLQLFPEGSGRWVIWGGGEDEKTAQEGNNKRSAEGKKGTARCMLLGLVL